jgi:class 3 adenylate cyclase/tetratricopeptide (TPR) repeat protein
MLGRNCPRCISPAHDSAQFCATCGTALYEQSDWASRATLAERKRLTVLFADLRSSTALTAALDPEHAMLRLDPALKAMAGAIQAASGTLNRLLGDGVMALFGAPHAMEDHAIRACRAADDLLNRISRLGDPAIAVRIGIATGNVVVHRIGSDANDFDVVGLPANLAARLEQLAEAGTALLAAETVRAAGKAVLSEKLGEIALKGLAEVRPVFRLAGLAKQTRWLARVSAGPLARFVGRRDERALIENLAVRAAQGNASAIAVVGEAGVGKSRLANEIATALGGRGWAVCCAEADPHSRNAPWHVGTKVLRALVGAEATDSPSQALTGLQQLGASWIGHAPFDRLALATLLDVAGAQAEWTSVPAPLRAARLRDALVSAVVQVAARAPLMVLIEDLHWVDESSLEFLRQLAAHDGLQLLLLATTRPSPDGSGFGPPWATVRLEPLNPADAALLLADRLGGFGAKRLGAQILARAEGTPLFIEELARAAIDGEVEELSVASALPTTLEAILTARIDQLPASGRRVLQIASVIGRDVPVGILSDVAGVAEAELRDVLDLLHEREFLLWHPRREAVVRFRHHLTQTAAYGTLLQSVRRALHARVLTCMETLLPAGAVAVEALAHHAFHAGEWPATVRHSRDAGRRAVRRSAWREASTYFDQAIEAVEQLAPTDARQREAVDLRLELRVPQAALRNMSGLVVRLDQAKQLAAGLADARRLAAIETERCHTLKYVAPLGEAVAAGLAAWHYSRAIGDRGAILAAGIALGQALLIAGAYAPAGDVLNASLALLNNEDVPADLNTTASYRVLLLTACAKTAAVSGKLNAAREHAERALLIADIGRRPFDRALARQTHGVVRNALDDHVGAVAQLQKALRIANECEAALLVPMIAAPLARAMFSAGRGREAIPLIEELLADPTVRQSDYWHGIVMAALAQVRLPDAPHAAANTARAALELAVKAEVMPTAIFALRVIGQALAALNFSTARPLLHLAQAMASRLGMTAEQRALAVGLSALEMHRSPPERGTPAPRQPSMINCQSTTGGHERWLRSFSSRSVLT